MTVLRALAAAQSVPIRGDVEANVQRHTELAHRAAEERVDVLVFPELSLTGYELDLADELAFAEDDSRLDPLVALSAETGTTLIVGAPVRLGPRLHIGAFILSPVGSIQLYTKRHLGEGEEALVDAGSRDPLVSAGGMVGSVAVCADVNRPSHAAAAAARGADAYLVSTFITPTDLAPKSANLQAYAARHAMTVVFANYGGPTGGLDSGGRSAIWSATGVTLAQLDGVGPGLVVAADQGGAWSGRVVY